jgi:hypothetical protein
MARIHPEATMRAAIATLLLLIACGEDPAQAGKGGDQDAGCDATADADGDGIDDCTEAELGTSPDTADTDGDGLTDAEELDCVSDPLDADEQCYACGWRHDDPGDLSPSGAGIGDTIDNLVLVDQCGEPVELHDFAGSYTLAFMTAAWCPLCMEEAGALDATAAALASETGAPVQGLVMLFQGSSGDVPRDADSLAYAESIEADATPVLGDVDAALLDAVPYDGRELPGVCLLSPSMEIVACTTGEGQLPAFAQTILDHAG